MPQDMYYASTYIMLNSSKCRSLCLPQQEVAGVANETETPPRKGMSKSKGTVHQYCLTNGLYGNLDNNSNPDSKTAKIIRKMKLNPSTGI